MTRKEAIERFNGIINAMSISVAQAKFYPTKAELDELCDMAIEALQAEYEDYEHATLVDIKEPLKVLVVRCKDCRYYWGNLGEDDTDEMYGECRWDSDEMPNADDFCSYGERREQNK